jgi:hypothetical protein
VHFASTMTFVPRGYKVLLLLLLLLVQAMTVL